MKTSLLCQRIHDVEWSGFLFFKIQGDVFNNPADVIIEPQDIYLQDIGTAAHTQFENMGEDVVDMYDKHPEWMKCRMGLVHSHNKMGVFFSGEDVSELHDNCPGTDYYFSLIVNNRGEYAARIAYMQECVKETVNIVTYKNSSRQVIERKYPSTEKQSTMIMVEFQVEVEVDTEFDNRLQHILLKTSRAIASKSFDKGKSNNSREYVPRSFYDEVTIAKDDDEKAWWDETRPDFLDETVSPNQLDMFTGKTVQEEFLPRSERKNIRFDMDSMIVKIITLDTMCDLSLSDALRELNDNFLSQRSREAHAEEVLESMDEIYCDFTGNIISGSVEQSIVKAILAIKNNNRVLKAIQTQFVDFYQQAYSL